MEIKDSRIDDGKAFDWGRTSKDYAKYRDIYPEIFYKKIVDRGLCIEGQSVLDLGTGTGVVPRNMYKYGARWTGTDISPEQIEQAKRLADEAGMKIDFLAVRSIYERDLARKNEGLPWSRGLSLRRRTCKLGCRTQKIARPDCSRTF